MAVRRREDVVDLLQRMFLDEGLEVDFAVEHQVERGERVDNRQAFTGFE